MDFPTVPRDRLDGSGCELAQESDETRFRLGNLTVRSATRLFHDAATKNATGELLEEDMEWRFFFATALAVDPPLPPTTNDLFVEPTVRVEAKRAFQSNLRERALTDVRRGPSKRIGHGASERSSLSRFRAVRKLPVVGVAVPIAGWVGT